MLGLLVLTQQFLAVFPRLVEDVGEFLVVLHDVLHHVRLVALEGETRPLHLHDDVEQVKELWRPLLILGHQVHNGLDLLGQDLQARRLVPSECLGTDHKIIFMCLIYFHNNGHNLYVFIYIFIYIYILFYI